MEKYCGSKRLPSFPEGTQNRNLAVSLAQGLCRMGLGRVESCPTVHGIL